MSDVKMHKPRGFNKHTPVSNKTVTSKTSRVFRSIGGTTFGPTNNSIEIEMRGAGMLVPSSFRLTGKIAQTGTYSELATLNGAGVHSLVEQIHVSYNGANLISLNQNAGYIACLDQNLRESVEEIKFDEVRALKGQELVKDTKYGFSMDLRKFGLDVEKFVPVNQATLQVRIVLADVKKVFHGASPAAAEEATYSLTDVALVADSYTLSQAATDLIQRSLNSSAGDTYISQVYTQNVSNFNSGTDQDLTLPMSYRNVVGVYFLPIQQTIPSGTNSNIANVDPIGEITYPGTVSDIASNVRVSFQGSQVYNNQNGNEAENTKCDHFLSILRSAQDSPDAKSFASGLADGYKTNKYQALGYSFLRDEYNNPHMTESGANGFAYQGQLRLQMTLPAQPTGRQLLTVGRVTNAMQVKNGAVSAIM